MMPERVHLTAPARYGGQLGKMRRMQVEHMGQALLRLPGSRGVWMHPELIRDMSGGLDTSGSSHKDPPVHVQEHAKGKCWL